MKRALYRSLFKGTPRKRRSSGCCATGRWRRRTTSLSTSPGSTTGSRRISTGCGWRARRGGSWRWSSSATRRPARCSRPACWRWRAGTGRGSRACWRWRSGCRRRRAASSRRWAGWRRRICKGTVQDFLQSESPFLRRLGIAACAVHRVDPGAVLAEAIEDPDAALRARALKAAGELGRADLLEALRAATARRRGRDLPVLGGVVGGAGRRSRPLPSSPCNGPG